MAFEVADKGVVVEGEIADRVYQTAIPQSALIYSYYSAGVLASVPFSFVEA